MRTGRPTFHVKARWITIDQPLGSHYYRLDDDGHLVLINGKVLAHKFVPFAAPSSSGMGLDQAQEIRQSPLHAMVRVSESKIQSSCCESDDSIDEFILFEMEGA
jgi:hypothetical protein